MTNKPTYDRKRIDHTPSPIREADPMTWIMACMMGAEEAYRFDFRNKPGFGDEMYNRELTPQQQAMRKLYKAAAPMRAQSKVS
jgi:hypothetical protein